MELALDQSSWLTASMSCCARCGIVDGYRRGGDKIFEAVWCSNDSFPLWKILTR